MTPWVPDFINGILASLLVFAFIGISIAINVNVILNFNRSMYKRPGYLTLTLPVSTNKLLAVKYLGSLIWVFIGYLVLAIGIVILSLLVGGVDFKDILEGGNILINILGEKVDEFILQTINYLAGISTMILSFFFMITLTKTKYIRLLYIERLKFKITFTFIAIEIPINANTSNEANIPLIKSGNHGVMIHNIKKIANVNKYCLYD
mgnify:CR=1 FL=1